MNKCLQKNCWKFLAIMAGAFLSAATFGDTACQTIVDKSICEKIGQMLIIGFGGFKQDDNGRILWDDANGSRFSRNSLIAKHIANDHIGGVILFVKSIRDKKTKEFIRDRNVQNPEQVAKLNQELQNYNKQMRDEQGLSTMPLFISVDQEGGVIDRLPASLGFPVRTLTPQALGAKAEVAKKWADIFGKVKDYQDALKETYYYAGNLAQELVAAHFNLNFFPTVDVNINPTSPIIGGLGRSFSSDPQVVIDEAKQFIKVFHEQGVIPVLKHFPGHGSSAGDSHDGLVDVTKTYNKEIELYPYSKLIQDGYDGVIMTTHVINGAIDKTQCKAGKEDDPATWCPGTMSSKTLNDLLRKQLGFKGIIISDDMTMGAIAKNYPLCVTLEKAVNAGVDMFIIANNERDLTDEFIITLAWLVKEGKIKRERIEEAYWRVVDFKKSKLQKTTGDLLHEFNRIVLRYRRPSN